MRIRQTKRGKVLSQGWYGTEERGEQSRSQQWDRKKACKMAKTG